MVKIPRIDAFRRGVGAAKLSPSSGRRPGRLERREPISHTNMTTTDLLKKTLTAAAALSVAGLGIAAVAGCEDEPDSPAEAAADAYEERTDEMEEQADEMEDAID